MTQLQLSTSAAPSDEALRDLILGTRASDIGSIYDCRDALLNEVRAWTYDERRAARHWVDEYMTWWVQFCRIHGPARNQPKRPECIKVAIHALDVALDEQFREFLLNSRRAV